MKIKLLNVIACVLVLLFFATFASQVVDVLARGRSFLYELAQMPQEQAYTVVAGMVRSQLQKGQLELPMDFGFEQVSLARLDAYLVSYGEGNIFDAIYARYKQYIPIRQEIGIPIAVMTILSLAILVLTEPRRPEDL